MKDNKLTAGERYALEVYPYPKPTSRTFPSDLQKSVIIGFDQAIRERDPKIKHFSIQEAEQVLHQIAHADTEVMDALDLTQIANDYLVSRKVSQPLPEVIQVTDEEIEKILVKHFSNHSSNYYYIHDSKKELVTELRSLLTGKKGETK